MLKPFAKLTKDAVQALRYRADDVQRSLTKTVIREARAKDLKMEMLNSSRLQVRCFRTNCNCYRTMQLL